MNRPGYTCHLLALLVVACGLRAWGIGFGLPLLSNLYVRPDESLTLTAALSLLLHGGDPRMYFYPAGYLWPVALLIQVLHVLRGVCGFTTHDLPTDWALQLSAYVLAARWISLFAGVATVAAAAAVGRELTRTRQGALLAGWLYALAPLAMREAKFATVDTWFTLWITLALWFLLRAVRHARAGAMQPRPWLGALTCASLACATKYNAAPLVAVVIGAAILLVLDRLRRHQPLGFSVGRWAVVGLMLPPVLFVLINPHVLRDPGAYLDTMRGLQQALSAQQEGQVVAPLWRLALRPLFFLSLGPGEFLGLLLAACGLLHLARHCRAPFACVGAFYACLYLPLVMARWVPFRYTLPLMPIIAALAAAGAIPLMSWVRRSLRTQSARALTALLLAALLLPGLVRGALVSMRLARTDSRTLAGDWITRHVPPSVPILLLTQPEAEPQLVETTHSLLRRLDAVRIAYGDAAATIINQPHQVRLDALAPRPADPAAYELWRLPVGWPPGALQVCVVHSEHVLSWGQSDDSLLLALQRGELVASTTIDPWPTLLPPGDRAYDRIDGFFLPMRGVARVERPGPRLIIECWRLPSTEPR